jgi:hypothetical protein
MFAALLLVADLVVSAPRTTASKWIFYGQCVPLEGGLVLA